MKIPNSHQVMKWLNPVLSRRYMLALWIGMGAIALLSEWWSHHINNNYFVFTHVYFHLIHKQPLYIPYPHEYADINLYGPLFGLLIAPFALLPDVAGVVCWVIINILFLFIIIQQLPVNERSKQFVILFSALELLMNAQWLQLNAFIAACLVGSFVYFKKDKVVLASLLIVMGSFTKLYGITGLAFIGFTKKPFKAVLWLIIWSLIAFCLPMLISSPAYIMHSYQEWFQALVMKNSKNVHDAMNNFYQDISAMGLIKRISGLSQDIDIWVIVSGLIIMAISFVGVLKRRFKPDIQLLWLSAIMLFTVLFSTGAESPTYIIAVVGVAIWFVSYAQEKYPRLSVVLMALVLLLTSIASTDLVTPWVRIHIVRRYALKALPCLIVWGVIVFDLMKYAWMPALHMHMNDTDKRRSIQQKPYSMKNLNIGR